MAATKGARVDMIHQVRDKRFMIIWHAAPMGWVVRRKKGVEKAVEFSPAYETNVGDFHGLVRSRWTWVPQGITIHWECL